MGKYYRKIETSNKFLKNWCEFKEFKLEKCNECVEISENQCKKLGRLWTFDSNLCEVKETRTCKSVANLIESNDTLSKSQIERA